MQSLSIRARRRSRSAGIFRSLGLAHYKTNSPQAGRRDPRVCWRETANEKELTMPRAILPEAQIHPVVREKIANYRSDVLKEVQAAVAANDIVVVGMRMNPFPRRARKALDTAGLAYKYIEYGSYLSEYRRRLVLKMWTSWPTFPMVFVKGVLVGGADDVARLIASGELGKKR